MSGDALWLVAQSSSDAQLRTDEFGAIRAANDAAVKALGRAEAQLDGTPLPTLVTLEDRRRFRRALVALTRGEPLVHEPFCVKPFGSEPVGVAVTAVRLDDVVHWVIQPDAVAAEPSAVQADEPERFLRAVIQRLEEGVVVVDTELNVLHANPAAQLLFRPEVLTRHRPLPDPWPEWSVRAFAEHLFASSGVRPEAHVTRPTMSVDVRGVHPRDSGFAFVVLRDVTEAHRRRTAEREFVSAAAHELRTPLAAIAGVTELLTTADQMDDTTQRRFVEILGREVTRATHAATALLVLARAEAGEEAPRMEVLPLLPIVSRIADAVRHATEPLQISVAVPPNLAIFANPELVEHLLRNLIVNAAKHGGGEIGISAQRSDTSAIVEIADAGPGMLPEHLDRALEPFRRGPTSTEGFGLGLSIASRMARALGGRLELASEVGAGTTARVFLPSGAVIAHG